MCLIAFAHDVGEFAWILAGNRDERYARAAAPIDWWPSASGGAASVFGGRDLEAGGGWLLLSTMGRLAAVTNVRRPPLVSGRRSRGSLTARFVEGEGDVSSYAEAARGERESYGGFNLLLFERGRACYVGSEPSAAPRPIASGVHALSNATLDTPWPKVERARAAMTEALAGPPTELATRLFAMLGDRTIAADEALPSTGIPLEIERMLSPIFIASSDYGTRCSTVVVVRRDGAVEIEERRFSANGVPSGTTRATLTLSMRGSRG